MSSLLSGERSLLRKSTAKKLKLLQVGPASKTQVCSMVMEGGDRDIRKQLSYILTVVGKLNNYQLKLHINKDVKPVAQTVQ